MLTSASFAYTVRCFHIQCWDFEELEKVALAHCTLASLKFVAGDQARRSRRNGHLIDAGSITAVGI